MLIKRRNEKNQSVEINSGLNIEFIFAETIFYLTVLEKYRTQNQTI